MRAKPWRSRLRNWAAGFTPPDDRPIYEWAHDNLTLPASYAVQGRFDVSINRPLIAVFDAIKNPRIHKIRFRKPPRFGGSLIADIAIPWICLMDPGPIMWNWQTDEDARSHMKEKALALWKTCKAFRAIMPRNRHDKTNDAIYFGPFFMVAQGANLSNLQSKGVRWMFNDELWLPVWQDLYGHAEARCGDFKKSGAYKITDVSQAGNIGDVEDRNWQEGQRAVWGYLAPDGKHYPLEFSGAHEDGRRWGLTWNDDAKREDGSYSIARAIETCRYVCRHTGKEWRDSPTTQAEWNRDGAYIETNPTHAPSTLSFAVNGLLNYTMADLVEKKIKALEMAAYGDMSEMRDFVQKYECRPWEETHLTVEIDGTPSGYMTAEYTDGKPLAGERFRTLMADRQHGIGGDTPHRWCEIRSWMSDGSSKQLYYGRESTKEAMRDLQQRYKVPDRCTWQDAAFEKHLVFQECAEYGWIGVFGSDQTSWAHSLPGLTPTSDPRKVRLPYSPWQRTTAAGKTVLYLHFSEDYCADILTNLVAGRGIGYEHPSDVSPAYLEQMKGEHKIQKGGRFVWEKIHSSKPNHAWDCGKMGICFGLLMKLLALPKPAESKEAKSAEAAA